MWFCVDVSQINKGAKYDECLMSRVDYLLDDLGGAKYLSSLDLIKEYWEIPLEHYSKETTSSFNSSFNSIHLFQFKRMHFDLQEALATFQSLMNKILQGQGEWCATYLDISWYIARPGKNQLTLTSFG